MPHTPTELLQALDQERQQALRPGYQREATAQLVRHIPVYAHRSGLITWSQIPPAQQRDSIQTQQMVFAERGLMLRWQCYEHDVQSLDLEGAGFYSQPQQSLWVAPSRDLAQWSLQQEHALLKVQDTSLLQQLEQVLEQVWGKYDAQRRAEHLRHLLGIAPDYCEVIAALAGPDSIMSCAWSYYPPDSPFAYLAGSTVLPESQNQGVYRQMLRLRAERALQKGREWLAVMVHPESDSLMRRLDFRRLSSRQIWCWRPTPVAGKG